MALRCGALRITRDARTDDHVVDSDERGQHAHRGDQPDGAVSGDSECQPNDIGFIRTPVAIEDRGRGLPIDVARTFNVGWNH